MRRKGFTLVEVVMVAVIVAMMAAIAMPRFSSAADSNRADVAARRVIADLALLRMGARAASANASATFTVASKSYTMTGVARATGGDPTVKLGEFPYNCTLELPANAATSTITFNQYGVPSGTLSLYVVAGKHKRQVTVDVNTGSAALLNVTVGGVSVVVQ